MSRVRVYLILDGSACAARQFAVVLVDAEEGGDVRIAFEDGVEVVVEEVVERHGQDCGARRITGTETG